MIEALYSIGMSDYMITSAGITILLCVVAFLAGRKMDMIPSGLQNIAEVSVEKLYGFFTDVMGPYACKKYFPIVGTLFIYILFCNYSGLLPLAGTLPGLKPPTASINFTAGMAIVVFIATQAIGIKHAGGLKFYKHLLDPVPALFILMVLEEFIKPISLTIRLYGNTYGDEEVVHVLFEMVPFGVPMIMQMLVVLLGLIQALVFSLLTATYISQAIEGAEHASGRHYSLEH